jgi:hypothetical protein
MLIIILSMIATLGLGSGIWMIVAAMMAPHPAVGGIITALAVGSIPFAIGTFALGAVAIVLAIERTAREQIAAINRGTEATIHVARVLVPAGAVAGNT